MTITCDHFPAPLPGFGAVIAARALFSLCLLLHPELFVSLCRRSPTCWDSLSSSEHVHCFFKGLRDRFAPLFSLFFSVSQFLLLNSQYFTLLPLNQSNKKRGKIVGKMSAKAQQLQV